MRRRKQLRLDELDDAASREPHIDQASMMASQPAGTRGAFELIRRATYLETNA